VAGCAPATAQEVGNIAANKQALRAMRAAVVMAVTDVSRNRTIPREATLIQESVAGWGAAALE
jgi:hypothetical protein